MNKRKFLEFLIVSELCEDDEYYLSKERKAKRKRIWMNDCYLRRSYNHHYSNESRNNLLQEFVLSAPQDLKTSLRIDNKTYELLLKGVQPFIEKKNTNMRECITPNERLAAALIFFSTGKSFSELKFTTSISPQSLGQIVLETSMALIRFLKDYLKVPISEHGWNAIAYDFELKSEFPNCIGAIGGRHIEIVKPNNSDSNYCNYKNKFSIVLIAVVNANYEFLHAEIGLNGNLSPHDLSNNLNNFTTNLINIPQPVDLENCNMKIPYVLVGNEAFPLREYLMTPYDACSEDKQHVIFNYRLARVERFVENTFDILSSRFRILLTNIKLRPQKVSKIVLACCYLHNFLCRTNANVYLQGSINDDNLPREECQENEKKMLNLEPMTLSQTTQLASKIRNNLSNHFNIVS